MKKLVVSTGMVVEPNIEIQNKFTLSKKKYVKRVINNIEVRFHS